MTTVVTVDAYDVAEALRLIADWMLSGEHLVHDGLIGRGYPF